ncbi:MAG TPA: homoserine O-succinyltransferase [Hellea balneolensis]|uniref:Homoserine O-succinyltransferase n=1 Tax=Hellea balneolensis TaxID=287478 RepID=A0A7C3GCN3_9PROT|nr:homoserine O-succinyltransferase [Hellea balneolensis]
MSFLLCAGRQHLNKGRVVAHDVDVNLGDHTLEYGDILRDDIVRGRIYGKAGNPLIVIPGGISASRFIADGEQTTKKERDGWWSDIVYSGGPVDLNHFQVLGLDFAPGGDNVNSPLTITTKDQAKRLAKLLDHLNIHHVHAMIGTSYGGMVCLSFAQEYPERVGKLCILGAAHRPYAMGVALRSIQRRIVDMGVDAGRPEQGLKLARELAMTTYRSAEEFSERFTATPHDSNPIRFDVGDYLEARGQHYHTIMPIHKFKALSESIDLHAVDPKKITAPSLLIATRSDQLVPPSEMQLMSELLTGPSELVTIDSMYGHDSFLKETHILAPLLSSFVQEHRHVA